MQADLKQAMKDRDSSRVAVLRATLGALANAEAVEPPTGPISLTAAAGTTEVARRELSDAEVRAVIERERAELLVAADERRARAARRRNRAARAVSRTHRVPLTGLGPVDCGLTVNLGEVAMTCTG